VSLALTGLQQRPALISTFHLTAAGTIERRRSLGLPEPEGAPIDRAVALMEETAARLSDVDIAVSCGVADELKALYGVPAGQVRTVYNWFDPAIFYPRPMMATRAQLGLDSRYRYLLYVGHFLDRRGQTVLHAMRLLPSSVRLIAVHPQPDPEVRREFGERVIFPGFLPPEELARFFSAADLQCFSPEYGAFGLVLVEGMACGCPAVVFDLPAMNEIVNPHCGTLVGEVGAAAYAQGIAEALDGPPRRSAAVQRASLFSM
jgi:glycosyltransferase involved in cell wall biosynthesis